MRIVKLSDEFVKNLAEIAAGKVSPALFEEFMDLVEGEISKHFFTRNSEINLLRIINAMYDKIFFLNECVKYPHYIELIVTISANSNYLSEILIINPEYFYWVVNPSTLAVKSSYKKLEKEIAGKIKNYSLLESKVKLLKAEKRKEMLRIGLRDIYMKTDLKIITAELSIIAKIITAELFKACYNEVLSRYKIDSAKRKYTIVALGKLGGNELNYSSDIDLIIFYDKNSKLRINKYYSEILTETIQLFLQKTSAGEAGFLYRVDLRLRPEGKNSPLCKSVSEYLSYYESRGDDWERQMLIKADYLCGSKTLFNNFISYLSPYIYPSTLSTSPVKQIRRLKHQIESLLNEEENIKLLPGGIRDIEFSVQALQLINGGKIKDLRTGNTLNAINKLKEHHLLTADEAETFTSAYYFYRNIEHYLQLMNNKQTHSIPSEGELLEKLTFYLGSKSSAEFKNEVEITSIKVRGIFNSIINPGKEDTPARISDAGKIYFTDRKKAENNLNYLKEGRGLLSDKQFDKKSIELFKQVEQHLINYLINSVDPDKVLSNFVRIIRFAEFPSIWYREFKDEKFFDYFLTLCQYSQRSIDFFAEDKYLRELMLSRDIFDRKIEPAEKIKTVLFKLSVLVTLKIISVAKASLLLSEFIKSKIKKISSDFCKGKKWEKDFFIAVMGSTGTGEMSFASDVDLIFTVNNVTAFRNVENEFQTLLKLFKDELHPVAVDCRLRPEGKSSQLVWDTSEYIKYFKLRAQTWEVLSFLKTNFVSGNNKLFNEFLIQIIKNIKRNISNSLAIQIDEIRKKVVLTFSSLNITDFKKGYGGLSDVEYIVYYLILSNPELISASVGKPLPTIANRLIKQNINQEEVKILKKNYIFLKELQMYNQLTANSNSSKLTLEGRDKLLLANQLGFSDEIKFLKSIKKTADENSKLYRKIILKIK